MEPSGLCPGLYVVWVGQPGRGPENNSHGFEFLYEAEPGCGVDQWDLLHAVSLLNVGYGFFGNNTTYAFGLGPFMWNTSSFGNAQGGYVFLGSPGHPINDIRIHNALSSADNGAAIYLDTYGGFPYYCESLD